jgi:hypothetical protein
LGNAREKNVELKLNVIPVETNQKWNGLAAVHQNSSYPPCFSKSDCYGSIEIDVIPLAACKLKSKLYISRSEL